MLNSRDSKHMTLLLVDDDTIQLELRAHVLKMLGFTVLTAASPVEAISLVAQPCRPQVTLAILDYEMPVMNGCILANYLRALYPELMIILHSGSVDIPETQLGNVSMFVPKGQGVARLLEQISGLFGNTSTATPAVVMPEACLKASSVSL
jgi:CheY-like chemotaxis protein